MAEPTSRRTPVARLARRLLPDALFDRVARAPFADRGHGFDAFGMSPQWVALSLGLFRPLYEHWFRVRSHGHEHIPTEGAAILAGNHSGTIPLDGIMVCCDVIRHTSPVRIPRAIADYFVSQLPVVNTLFSRSGVVGGSRGNVHHLLEEGELLLLFPEGSPGISKPFSDRYQLQTWRPGHVELAIRHQVPVIPFAVIGAEEQLPQLARLPIKLFGAPHLPLTPGLVPLPVRYHIYYGAPIELHRSHPPSDATDPEALEACAEQVRSAVEALIARGLAEREGVFA